MKKHITSLLLLLAISMCLSPVLSNYFHGRDTIAIADVSEFLTWTLVPFLTLSLLFFGIKTR